MSIRNPNLPKSILAFRSYAGPMFLHDLLAGVMVGLVALPLATAFGIASGVTPQAGRVASWLTCRAPRTR